MTHRSQKIAFRARSLFGLLSGNRKRLLGMNPFGNIAKIIRMRYGNSVLGVERTDDRLASLSSSSVGCNMSSRWCPISSSGVNPVMRVTEGLA